MSRISSKILELFAQVDLGRPFSLRILLNYAQGCIALEWTRRGQGKPEAVLYIRCTGCNELTFASEPPGELPTQKSFIHPGSIHGCLEFYRKMFPTDNSSITCSAIDLVGKKWKGVQGRERPWESLAGGSSPWTWLEEEVWRMGQELSPGFDEFNEPFSDFAMPDFQRFARREARRQERAEQEQARRAELRRELEERRQKKREREAARRERDALIGKPAASSPPALPHLPAPPVPCAIEPVPLQFQETLLPVGDLRSYFLLERAAHWWISNQSDDLLGLPYCDIERLEYQLRTALRVIGPLRGRALLSDEVGLGKTIEAGLVIKEYLTRGMLKRFLVLTVPSLVDQWQEELSEKFHLATVTTNEAVFRSDPNAFWQQNCGIVASLHTLKQPAHLAIAQTINWDMLVVDEAHYLRNRTSQAWQAVNALPRQFLLLLTATPVQNSLEDLYNLVTLLQPGQLPSPKEFRARYIDPKRPHQAREPEELRRLLGQVMIRNTRANAGVKLPPRRAETVLFAPTEAERERWQNWEGELRTKLAGFNASQSSLWGRLLLQTAGSSPAAWRRALESFPDAGASEAWTRAAPLESSWGKKCQLVVPLTQAEGGVVLFTQFVQTQAALAEYLQAAHVPTWVINGQTPSRDRQAITESFRSQGGALLLTHNGTEGRNLQFSHRLVNFDLPWNPMEIEQRIGRLHRIGQEHPVRIYNFVQAGTLQEHLLQILQEKLNLFELVVGETGLILGDRFSSDEFAEEVFRRWRDSEGRVGESMAALGQELAAARVDYDQIKKLDETLFAHDYESA